MQFKASMTEIRTRKLSEFAVNWPPMSIEELRSHCLSKRGTTEGLPFDENTLVFKVMGKMFALADVDGFESVNLKCLPEVAVDLREKYAAVKPGYHMNKTHWNTVQVNGDAADKLIYQWVDASYDLIVLSLTKKQRMELALAPIGHRSESFAVLGSVRTAKRPKHK